MHYRIVLCNDCFGFGLSLTDTERRLRSTLSAAHITTMNYLDRQLAGSMRPRCYKCKGTGWVFDASKGESILRYLKTIRRPNLNLDESANEESV